MSQPNPSTAMARALVDELRRGGIRHFVISPGSRSSALAIAAIEADDCVTTVVIDERSAGFHALGVAKASGVPAALISTSGTAPGNYMPAIIEARMSLTPLIIMSADRPAEMRGVGANQTIDQVKLFGGQVNTFIDIPAPDSESDLNSAWRSAASRAIGVANGFGGRPGPVHINVAFREPTVPVSDDGRTQSDPYPFSIDGAPDDAPWSGSVTEQVFHDALDLPPTERGLIIAGDGVYDGELLSAVADGLGWPVLATCQSALGGEGLVTRYHHILSAGIHPALRPDVVVGIGAIGPSSRLEDLVASAQTRIRIDFWGRITDPNRNATALLRGDPVDILRGLAPAASADRTFERSWATAERLVDEAMGTVLDESGFPSGAAVVSTLGEADWETIVVGSSLPIREVDAHLVRGRPVIANRGASGIDGFNSTALGAASAVNRAMGLTGDLGFLHDANAFLNDGERDLVIVVMDNDGGGLFDGLPQAVHAPSYERLFVTPHRRDLSLLADFHGLRFQTTDELGTLAGVVDEELERGGISIVRVPISRDADVKIRLRLDESAAAAVSSLGS